jgi:F-type H+-transporting ATPase subunit b
MELYQSLVAVEPATLIVTICNLFLQMYIVKKFFLNKVMAVLDKRRETADQEIVQARTAKQEALAIKSTYEENMRQVKAEANEILTHAQKTAVARSEEIIGQAQAQAARIKEKASAEIAQEKKKALNEAKDEISGIAIAIAEKVVERQLNEEDQEKLVNQFIENLGGAL